ncbi:MAG: hydrogenase nickel incorporation protein HypB [Coriobacteriales bacterium]|jgi:hydrogenase nickel incorporation protein HypB|nr:hydrogenase nickel incorporation protein HypB [Coriobacteriales bacterium]
MAQIDIQKPILDANDRIAAENRKRLDDNGIYMLDLLASPGAGKTSLILATIERLKERYKIAIIEGDIASDVDSQKVKSAGVPAIQINTGGLCHLESQMISRALDALDEQEGGLAALDIIIIENVGNLVCPVDFYLGEDAKVMVLSVPEGHDKPLKYPGIFQASRAVALNKIDVMPAFDFDTDAFRASVAQLNPKAPVFALSATHGDGVDEWINWILGQLAH